MQSVYCDDVTELEREAEDLHGANAADIQERNLPGTPQ